MSTPQGNSAGRHLDETYQDRDAHTDQELIDTEPVDSATGRGNPEVVTYEERTELGTEVHETGHVRVRKDVETVPVEQVVPRSVEHADISERLPATEGDTGEVITLDDGSVSIPVFEEVLVVTKKLVVRERVVVRKQTVVDEYTLQTELRREHAVVDADGDVEVEDRRRT